MWPIFLYMTKEECFRSLRQLELDAYSMLVSALRAQGPLTSEKRKVLRDVCKVLNISADRHRCEVRRAVNDEKLNTIAYQINGLDISIEDWCQEGRRVLPMLQRISPHTLHPIITDDLGNTSVVPHGYPQMQHSDEQVELRDDLATSANELDQDTENSPPREYRLSTNQSAALEPDKTYSAKTIPNKNHKLMVVSNAETCSTNSILQKTLSVPVGKVAKLNLEKFKIVPSSFSSNFQVSSLVNVNKNFLSNKTGKRIIPLSQLQMLNHKFSSKGGIKVLPISSKILGKNITMTRITNHHGLKTPILQPFVSSSGEIPALSKIKVENIEIVHEITSQMEQSRQNHEASNEGDEINGNAMDEANRLAHNEIKDSINETVAETGNVTDDGKAEEVGECKKQKSEAEQGDLASLMEIDSSEFLESELKEEIVIKE